MTIGHPPPATCNLARWASFYDAIYAARGKRYDVEAAQLAGLAGPGRRTWLDVACGTAEHLKHLAAAGFEVSGVDASPEMLAVARRKLPESSLIEADMTTFDLGRRFDVVSCLFASICYLPDADAVTRAVQRMADHLTPGGILIIEPGPTPDELRPPTTTHMSIPIDNGTLERTTSAQHTANRLRIQFSFTIRRANTVETFTDNHSVGIFPAQIYTGAIRSSGPNFDVSTFRLFDFSLRRFDVSLHIGLSSIV